MDQAVPSFEETYSSIATWVKSYGWIEVGRADWHSDSMLRVLDDGGMVWEGQAEYATLDELLRDLEGALAEWFEDNASQKTP